MKWVTRSRMHIDRTATAWLIRRSLDPPATFLFVEPDEVATTPESARLWAISQGFTDVARDDAETLDRASSLYDALYAHLRRTRVERSA